MIPEDPPSCQVGEAKLFLNGASGRMGQRINEVVQAMSGGVTIVARRDKGDASCSEVVSASVVVDFSCDEGAREALAIAVKANCALLVGTTGLSEGTKTTLRDASTQIPVLVAPNTSVGIAVMRALVSEASALLGDEYTAVISETHHTRKLDKPSGTALLLAEAIDQESATPIDRSRIESRREGDVIGDHEVRFVGGNEELSIRHHAVHRDLFATGAVRLACWIGRQKPGLYGLDDWLESTRRRAQ
ncbi:MAG: 4-hydroxy-tetrahydrodipicolinate reductase [Phycisphaerales bacterium]|nr:4-hydroxy-tetrahydrodipicolinate reductase [Phycisphaerales bacterium]